MNKRKLATLIAASFAGLMLSSPSFATEANKAKTPAASPTSAQAVDAAKADYKAAVEKCDAQPTGQRSACVQDAKAAQTLAMEKSRDGTPATSGAPEKRIPGQQSAK
jgi:hypothetical protein